jgi:hypothetical protein
MRGRHRAMGRGHLHRLPAGPERPRCRCENVAEAPEDGGGDVDIQGLGEPHIGGGQPRIDLDHNPTRGFRMRSTTPAASPGINPSDRPRQGFERRALSRGQGRCRCQTRATSCIMLRSNTSSFQGRATPQGQIMKRIMNLLTRRERPSTRMFDSSRSQQYRAS